MESRADTSPHLKDASKRLAHQVLAVCENRLQIFFLEAQEERENILRAFCLAAGVGVFVLLAGVALTLLVAAACWAWSPVAALAILFAVYFGTALFFYRQLLQLRRDWQFFSATFDELKKDRECLRRHLN